MGKKKKKKKSFLKSLVSGNTFAGNIVSGIVVAMILNVLMPKGQKG